jgi:DNA (cytosine-5)-methyltransferase 1
MKLMSLFDGSGSFPLSAKLCGIEPVYASEVEPFPIAVTRARFPDMIHLGDVSKINGAELEPVDIVTFGSPCQDLSVAGKRAGLQDGARSSLFFQAIRIIKEMRESTNGRYPRFAVWENVHGAFSSNKGEDFKAVLEQFCMLGAGCDVPIPRPAKWGGCRVHHGGYLLRCLAHRGCSILGCAPAKKTHLPCRRS